MDVLTEDQINPFGLNLPKDKLINLAPGVEFPENITNEILNRRNFGNEKYAKFLKEHLMERKIKNLIYSVSRTHIKVFNYIFNVKISQIKIVKPIEVDHILTKTLAISSMKRKAIDFGMALQYPLSPIPLRLCNGNKTMRQTIKSGLCDILESDNPKRNSRSYYQKYWNDS